MITGRKYKTTMVIFSMSFLQLELFILILHKWSNFTGVSLESKSSVSLHRTDEIW